MSAEKDLNPGQIDRIKDKLFKLISNHSDEQLRILSSRASQILNPTSNQRSICNTKLTQLPTSIEMSQSQTNSQNQSSRSSNTSETISNNQNASKSLSNPNIIQSNCIRKYFQTNTQKPHSPQPIKQPVSLDLGYIADILNLKLKKLTRQEIDSMNSNKQSIKQRRPNPVVKNINIHQNHYFIHNFWAQKVISVKVDYAKPNEIYEDIDYGMDSDDEYKEMKALVLEGKETNQELLEDETETQGFVVDDSEIRNEQGEQANNLNPCFVINQNKWIYSHRQPNQKIKESTRVLFPRRLVEVIENNGYKWVALKKTRKAPK